MWIDHRKEIRKLTFRALALGRSEPSWQNQIILLYFPPTQTTVYLATNPPYSYENVCRVHVRFARGLRDTR